MRADRYPTVFDAVALHEFIMQHTGAAPAGLRDEGALEGALARAQHAAFYEDASLAGQAILLLVGVALAHAFVDGNKRTAFIVMETFLDENGWTFGGDGEELAHRLVALVAEPDHRRRDTLTSGLVTWLEPHLVPAHAAGGAENRPGN